MLDVIRSWPVSSESRVDFFDVVEFDGALLGTGEMNSISSGPDDGSINKLAGLFWMPMRHATVSQCRANFSDPRRTLFPEPAEGQNEHRNFNLAGHGSNGYVETGAGQGFGDEYVSYWNKDHWGWSLALAGRDWDGMFSIWSCLTGAGHGGSTLLFDLAHTMERPVRARTGLTMVVTQGSRRWLEFERNSVWQTADPGMSSAPPPIDPPSIVHSLMLTKFLSERGLSPVPIGDIASMTLQIRDRSAWRQVALNGSVAANLATKLFHSAPFPRGGIVPGIVTLQITMKLGDGATVKAEVISNRLLEIEGSDSWFIVSNDLEDFINELGSSAV